MEKDEKAAERFRLSTINALNDGTFDARYAEHSDAALSVRNGSILVVRASNVDDDAYVVIDGQTALHVRRGEQNEYQQILRSGRCSVQMIVGNGGGGEWSANFVILVDGVKQYVFTPSGFDLWGTGPRYPWRQTVVIEAASK